MLTLLVLLVVAYIVWLKHVQKTDPKRFEQLRADGVERNKKIVKVGGKGLITLISWIMRL